MELEGHKDLLLCIFLLRISHKYKQDKSMRGRAIRGKISSIMVELEHYCVKSCEVIFKEVRRVDEGNDDVQVEIHGKLDHFDAGICWL